MAKNQKQKKQQNPENSAVKESTDRIKVLEEHIFAGIKKGIDETKNLCTVHEIIDVLTRYQYQYNKRGLDFTREQVQKDADKMNDHVIKMQKK